MEYLYRDVVRGVSRVWMATHRALYAQVRAVLLDIGGRPAEAEALVRSGLPLLTSGRSYAESPELDEQHAFLARTLIHQGRLLEAESEARKAVVGALARQGRNTPHTAWMLRSLVWVLREQGRYAESERLARAVVDIYRTTLTAPESLRFAVARTDVAMVLALQGRYVEALAEYEGVLDALRVNPARLQALLDGHLAGAPLVSGYADALLQNGHAERALAVLRAALARSDRLVGALRSLAEIRAALARAYVARGDSLRAVQEFRAAIPVLLARGADIDDESMRPHAADHALAVVLGAYVGLLADIRGTSVEREAGIDAAAEAFALADLARGRSVHAALSASAVRAAAQNPALADVVRRKQDGRQQIAALHAALAARLGDPAAPARSADVAQLRERIATLRSALDALTAQVEREFPAYAELIHARAISVEQARATLRPGEALIATLTTSERTFVWAVPRDGPIAFAAEPLDAETIARTVATLRGALEPRALTLADVPDFDVALAHRLFTALLDPVRPGWQDARSLLVVAHGPLGQLPFALLPTRPIALARDAAIPFANYRAVPWLVQSHAVTVLPSVSSLVALRSQKFAETDRRAFVGFGDPYFSHEQAAAVEEGKPAHVALVTRSAPLTFRRSAARLDAAQLARLPRLSETADEIRDLARAMHADLDRDVFLGRRANEHAVKSLDLARYRVVAFATHGLVPGELEGLTQPALALSAPEVAGVDGDGVLTLDEILTLRLNADWIVLSACNTASGQGTGAESMSGLGRAFFYAGARALLASSWPVETTSARALTTELFRRQAGDPGVSRAEALRQTMSWLIERGELRDGASGAPLFSYAHPIFWAPFSLVGDGGTDATP